MAPLAGQQHCYAHARGHAASTARAASVRSGGHARGKQQQRAAEAVAGIANGAWWCGLSDRREVVGALQHVASKALTGELGAREALAVTSALKLLAPLLEAEERLREAGEAAATRAARLRELPADHDARFGWAADVALVVLDGLLRDPAVELRELPGLINRLAIPIHNLLEPARLSAKLAEYARVLDEHKAAATTSVASATALSTAFIDTEKS